VNHNNREPTDGSLTTNLKLENTDNHVDLVSLIDDDAGSIRGNGVIFVCNIDKCDTEY
jgi:hypothetical protein